MNPGTAIVMLRIATGLLVAPHGIRKLLAGPSSAIGPAIARSGLPLPDLFAWLVTIGELAGILLVVGVAVRAAGFAIAITMLGIVIFVQKELLLELGTGASVPAEYPVLLAVLGAFFAALGGKVWSIPFGRAR
jgi:putative oxidoreductase